MDIMSEQNCAVNECTGDGTPVGRCFFYVGTENRCPRHGDVTMVQEHYCKTGKLTDEKDLKKWQREQ